MTAIHRGIAYIVGAGPKNHGLITLLGLEKIKSADCIIHDAAVSPSLLGEAPVWAEIIDLGEAPADQDPLSQEEINTILCDKVSEGKTVVRLKAGDPYIFSNGEMEIAALSRRGLKYQVVPGVSMFTAAACFASIPLTNHGTPPVIVLADGQYPDRPPQWEALARGEHTLCIYNSTGNLSAIAQTLLHAGREASEPAALISNIAEPDQNIVEATVGDLAHLNAEAIPTPALLVVGKTVKQRHYYSWFEKRPFFGKTILLTSFQMSTGRLGARFSELGACVMELPTYTIEPTTYRDDVGGRDPLTSALIGLTDLIAGGPLTWIVFTCADGVRETWRRMLLLGLDARIFGGAGVAAIGAATAQELAARGIFADLIPEKDDPDSLFDEVKLRLGASLEEYQFVIFSGNGAADNLVKNLGEEGALCYKIVSYHVHPMIAVDATIRRAFDDGAIDAAPFESANAVQNFVRLFFDRLAFWVSQPARPRFIAMDETTAREMRTAEMPIDAIAAYPSLDNLIKTTAETLGVKLPE